MRWNWLGDRLLVGNVSSYLIFLSFFFASLYHRITLLNSDTEWVVWGLSCDGLWCGKCGPVITSENRMRIISILSRNRAIYYNHTVPWLVIQIRQTRTNRLDERMIGFEKDEWTCSFARARRDVWKGTMYVRHCMFDWSKTIGAHFSKL